MKKKIFYIVIILLMTLNACKMPTNTNGNFLNNIDDNNCKRINTIMNLIPVYEDENNLYYAEEAKTLKKRDNNGVDSILDACSEDELIGDICTDNQYIYYVKQNAAEVKIVRVSKNDVSDVQVVHQLSHGEYTFGEDFIYVQNDVIYYYDSADYVIYIIKNDGIQTVDDVTSAFIAEEGIYYADKSGNIYESDFYLKDIQEIWNIDAILQEKNEFVENWRETCMSEYTEITNLSLINDKLVFTLFADRNVKNGLLCAVDVEDGSLSFDKNCTVDNYQISKDSMYFYGSYLSENGIYKYGLNEDIIPIKIDAERMYLSNGKIYFWNDEINYKTLKIFDL